jgi:hypothetical protein
MAKRRIWRWLDSGTLEIRFAKIFVFNFVLAFAIYCVISYKSILNQHFLVADLWVIAVANGLGFGSSVFFDKRPPAQENALKPSAPNSARVSSN